MTAQEQLGLWANLPKQKARRRLREMATEGRPAPTADAAYDLVLAATEDQEAAERAWRDHRRAELRAGITPQD